MPGKTAGRKTKRNQRLGEQHPGSLQPECVRHPADSPLVPSTRITSKRTPSLPHSGWSARMISAAASSRARWASPSAKAAPGEVRPGLDLHQREQSGFFRHEVDLTRRGAHPPGQNRPAILGEGRGGGVLRRDAASLRLPPPGYAALSLLAHHRPFPSGCAVCNWRWPGPVQTMETVCSQSRFQPRMHHARPRHPAIAGSAGRRNRRPGRGAGAFHDRSPAPGGAGGRGADFARGRLGQPTPPSPSRWR